MSMVAKIVNVSGSGVQPCPLNEFYRCPDTIVMPRFTGELSTASDYIPDVPWHVAMQNATAPLAFGASDILDYLRREHYAANGYLGRRSLLSSRPVRQAYYCVRPFLPLPVKKQVQRLFLRDWRTLQFPRWPVDTTVEQLLERLLLDSMKARELEAIPFIWFWPDGASSCLMLTHDVETRAGADFVPELMNIDDSFGFKASFQVIPRKQYPVSDALLNLIRTRGFELNVHDLSHDGNLFGDRDNFLRSARCINRHLKQYGAAGFRAGRMYRNADWLEALDIAYDMSAPNVGHLEAQRGGCCTVFPYFIGNILELPLTTTQDYSLFHILGEFSINLWKEQISLITGRHGLASFIIHPDYIRDQRPLAVYKNLLGHLSRLRDDCNAWAALPQDVNQWWRERSRMALACENGQYVIQGSGRERARVAFARLADGGIVYEVATQGSQFSRSRGFADLERWADGP